MKRYRFMEAATKHPAGEFVLYTDAVKMQREAYVAGVLAPVGGIAWDDEAMKKRKRWAEAEASRRYKEEL